MIRETRKPQSLIKDIVTKVETKYTQTQINRLKSKRNKWWQLPTENCIPEKAVVSVSDAKGLVRDNHVGYIRSLMV